MQAVFARRGVLRDKRSEEKAAVKNNTFKLHIYWHLFFMVFFTKMSAVQGKYDYIITALLPLHRQILAVKDDPEGLIIYINQLKEYIALYDRETEIKLNVISRMLTDKAVPQKAKGFIFEGSKKEVLSILTKFFFEVKPDE